MADGRSFDTPAFLEKLLARLHTHADPEPFLEDLIADAEVPLNVTAIPKLPFPIQIP